MEPNAMEHRVCTICRKSFKPRNKRHRICAWKCKQEHIRHYGRAYRLRPHPPRMEQVDIAKPLRDRLCAVCGEEFKPRVWAQHICSPKCRQKAANQKIRQRNREVRRGIRNACIVCGFDLTTDIHHEAGRQYRLCPNHHALITRGIMKTEEVLRLKTKRTAGFVVLKSAEGDPQ